MKLIQIQKQNAMKQNLSKKIQVKVNRVIFYVIKMQNLLKINQIEVIKMQNLLKINQIEVNRLKVNKIMNLNHLKINIKIMNPIIMNPIFKM